MMKRGLGYKKWAFCSQPIKWSMVMGNDGLVWIHNCIFQLGMHWEKSVCVGAGDEAFTD